MTPDLRAQPAKAFLSQGLCQHVRQLLCCPNGLKSHLVLLDALSDVVIPDIYVLAAVVEHRVLAQCNGGLIVGLQCGCAGLLAFELCKKPRQPGCLTCSSSCSYIFSLARG